MLNHKWLTNRKRYPMEAWWVTIRTFISLTKIFWQVLQRKFSSSHHWNHAKGPPHFGKKSYVHYYGYQIVIITQSTSTMDYNNPEMQNLYQQQLPIRRLDNVGKLKKIIIVNIEEKLFPIDRIHEWKTLRSSCRRQQSRSSA